MPAETLTDAIEKAVEKTPFPQDVSETQKVEKPEDKVEDKTEQKEEVTEQVVDPEVEQGLMLVRALKDPQQASIVIDYLAKQAGYTKGELKTTPQEEAKADLTAILKEELGDEFAFLATKIGKGLDKYLSNLKLDDNRTSTLEERLERSERREIESEISTTHTSLAQTYFGSDDMPDNVIQEMNRAMDKFPANDPSQSPSEYYSDIFNFVAGKLGLQKKSGGRADRVARNREDAPARNLSATNRGITAEPNGSRARKMSLKDSVQLAMEQVEEEASKRK